jgi:hypothetical protein
MCVFFKKKNGWICVCVCVFVLMDGCVCEGVVLLPSFFIFTHTHTHIHTHTHPQLQDVTNTALRESVAGEHTGCLVIDVAGWTNAAQHLKKDDVVLSIDGHKLQNDKTVCVCVCVCV